MGQYRRDRKNEVIPARYEGSVDSDCKYTIPEAEKFGFPRGSSVNTKL
jgi:hypothetical protein